MRKFFSKISALIISLIVIGISFYLISIKLMQQGLPEDNEIFDLPGLKQEVKIYKNEFGIPHIIAANEHDMFYSLGFMHAQDRFWQMTYNKMAAQGRLAEILGKDYVSRDMFMRVMGIRETVKNMWDSLNPKSKEILIAYSDGINIFLKNNINKLSLEFGALNIKPELWTPYDCLYTMRGFSFELSQNIDLDLIMGQIAEKVGMQKAMELIPQYPATAPSIIEGKNPAALPFPNKDTANVIEIDSTLLMGYNGIYPVDILELREKIGRAPSYGSNCWSLSNTKTSKHGTLLANDPHLSFSVPSKFYQAHITAPGYNAVGLTLPGVPLVLIGRNDNVAWGITNMMADDADLFVERVDSKSTSFFDPDSGKFRKFELIEDTIKIKDEETHKFYIRKSNKSLVLNDAFQKKLTQNIPASFRKYILTYRWVGNLISDEIYSLYLINKSNSGFDIESALKYWKTPLLIFNYADKRNNIGILSAGALPLRQGINPNLPNPAYYGGTDWTGYLKSSDLPKLHNPDSGYCVAVNNIVSFKFPYYISNAWASSDRSTRLFNMLDESEAYNYRDAQFMQIDAFSIYAQEIMRVALPILKKYSNKFSKTEKKALDLMDDWDFVMSARNIQPSIYNIMMVKLMKNIFEDELGPDLFKLYLSIHSFPQNKLMEILFSDDEYWYDNKNTSNFEGLHYIVINSYRQAVNDMLERFKDPDPARWLYGELNRLTLYHNLSQNKLLKPALNLGPRSMNGNVNTVNPAIWDFNDPFKVKAGAVARFISDLTEDDIYTILPGGSSGDALDIDYSNQFQLYLSGGYIKMTSKRNPGTSFKLATTLVPAKVKTQ